MSIFNLIIVLFFSIFGAYFINKILEEITAQSNSKRKAIEKRKAINDMESTNDSMNSDENAPFNPPQDSATD